MRTITIVLGLAVAGVAGLEAQATASPASRTVPRTPARGIRTEPPPAAEPGQQAQPTRPSQPGQPQAPSGEPSARGTTTIINNIYTYAPGTPEAYASTDVGYAQQAPPPSQIDVRGPQPAPATAFIPGYWVWTGSSYNWNEGRWVAIPAGYSRWVPGRWVQNQFGWYFLRGYWEP